MKIKMKIKLYSWQKIIFILAAFWSWELLSFSLSQWPEAQMIVWPILVLLTALVSVYKLEYGLLIVLGELLAGSMGHLFYADFDFGRISLRVGLFAALMSVFLLQIFWKILRGRSREYYEKAWEFLKENRALGILAVFVVFALLNALVRGHEPALIFSDFNAWLYFLLIGPLLAVYDDDQEVKFHRLKLLFMAAVWWLSFKTLFLLFVFAHSLESAAPIYYWLRRTLGGEVTAAGSGWPRVFIQGQVYAACAFLLVLWRRDFSQSWRQLFKRESAGILISAAIFLSVVLVSLSRSFWVALVGVLIISLILLWRFYSARAASWAILWLSSIVIVSIILIFGIINAPYKQGQNISLSSTFLDRVMTEDEPAMASRWALLPVLLQEIKQAPLFGQGFGATISYFSLDPRVLANNPDGYYTTYAFEWAYLDMWLKLGLFGLAAYLWFLCYLLFLAFKKYKQEGNRFYLGLVACLIFLALTNIFTPYLNHPLGIGFLLIALLILRTDDNSLRSLR